MLDRLTGTPVVGPTGRERESAERLALLALLAVLGTQTLG
jgi:hypothetical protein